MKYDDASWHYGGNFPAGQPQEHGGTHIALFLKWCFIKGWAGELHTQEEPEAVINGSMLATDFFFKYCDGKLTNESLNKSGNAFAELYYGDDGFYLDDYAEHFGNFMYLKPETAFDFAKYSAILNARLKSSVLAKNQVKAKPWWQFW